MSNQSDGLIPVSEAAKRKECTRQTIYNALDRGDIVGMTFTTVRLVVVNKMFEEWEAKNVGRRAS